MGTEPSSGHSHSHGGAAMADHRGRLAVVLATTISVMVAEVRPVIGTSGSRLRYISTPR
jgi:hypothetical protein